MATLNPSILFKTSATIYAICAPAHAFLGFDVVYPALGKITPKGKDSVGRRGAENCWNYVMVSLLINAALNWQWARTGGPQTKEENIILWLITGMHAINGLRYVQVGLYSTIFPFWVAPALSIIASRSR